MLAILRELCALAALATFVGGIATVGTLVAERHDVRSASTISLAAR